MNQKNVYELTQERLKMIFEEFDNNSPLKIQHIG